MSSSHDPVMIEKQIQRQVRQSAGLYTMNFAALHTTTNTENEGLKHDSYQRYLNKKKGKMLISSDVKFSGFAEDCDC
jgi:hypothetical protein